MSEFAEHLQDVFADFGTITLRKMFGGYGVYHDECMFGLIADDILYLKVDAENEDQFESLGLPAFEYAKKDGKIMAMSFRQAPESIHDDRDDAALWARSAWEAARRAKLARSKTRKKSPRSSSS